MKPVTMRRPPLTEVAQRRFDLIVVGGGVTGAGVALDAAARGLSVLVVEKGDFASGTSSKSTKLVHGGLRYLQNLQFAVTLESVRERELVEELAPHMVWRVPFLIPLYRKNRFKNLKLRIGLTIYDLMAGLRKNGFHERVSRCDMLKACPGIDADGLTGGLRYYDCRTDDARYTLELLRTAVSLGAVAINYAEVTSFIKEDGAVKGIIFSDHATTESKSFGVRGDVVINATGVWTQKTAELSGVKSELEIVPASGIHIVLPRTRLPLTEAMIVNSAHDKRFCFAVPWYDSVIVGTTDKPFTGDIENLQVDPEDVTYVLDALNKQFPDAHLSEDDVSGKYIGVRPLIKEAGASSTADVSRKHCLRQSADGVVTIAGGKLTTYRRMAEDTVDLVVKLLGAEQAGRKFARCSTDQVMIGGWLSGQEAQTKLTVPAGCCALQAETLDFLHCMYGRYANDVLALVLERPELAQPIHAEHPYIMAQAVFAARHEAAFTLEDVLSRRVRLLITDAKAACASADAVSHVIASELGWSEDRRALEVARFAAICQKG